MKSLLSLFFLFFSIHLTANPVLLVVGTRPEAIKMAPVYHALKSEKIETLLCSTGQHAELLKGALAVFEMEPDFELNIMKPGQDLFYITERVLEEFKTLLQKVKPSLVVVQGDTTTAFSAALAAFYLKIPVAHVEAGLRTKTIHAPFPEEMNRRVISQITTYHLAPTQHAMQRLLQEGAEKSHVFYTGNTVVDALQWMSDRLARGTLSASPFLREIVERESHLGHRVLLLTAHRRESLDQGLEEIFSAVKATLQKHPELHVIYPHHPNPAIQKLIAKVGLEALPNLTLLSPLAYTDLVYLLDHVDGIATDSGGIQEEGISLGKPVLVLRNETDRPEGLSEGALLVGTSAESVASALENLIAKGFPPAPPNLAYGDGHAAERIVTIIKEELRHVLQN